MTLVRRRRNLPTRRWNVATPVFSGQLFDELDRMFSDLQMPIENMQAYPADLYESRDALVLEMAVPGVDTEELDISLEGRQLSISGSFEDSSPDDERRYWLQSLPRGEFNRSVSLPVEVEAAEVKAEVKNGLLTLTLPKVAEAKAKKIEIQRG